MKKKSFTLVELMAVILIIGILMGLVSALIPQLRERSRRTQCANNLRQVGLAIESYAQDNNLQYPFSNPIAVPSEADLEVLAKNKLSSYIKDIKICQCPSTIPEATISYFSSQGILSGKAYKLASANEVDETFVIALDGMLMSGYDIAENHSKPTYFKNVLFGDGRVKGYTGTSKAHDPNLRKDTVNFQNIYNNYLNMYYDSLEK